ncbi:GcrA cell cycle regulator [Siccirubricoccus deserti]|uniref:GcrA cell cycle regulator n=1 Tax=Siccirubricoccus deserti TaxID=2013562 RepID=A0A9X0QW00_9PROT|nr:GcrA family cell cycle regulator [Siccirubricoccus deserti]MBC4014482.1 GcrA cell cycle regulator [Siccirubricoccus deserti]GGC32556.1 GcrA cell cycle regulator [Siccirubricoccus deserti]
MDWTSEAIDQLRAFWDEGHSTAEIGRRMGISKNAVVGKAHRLNLPARPSPIRREAEPSLRMPAQPRQAPPTLPAPTHAPAPPQRRLEERPPAAPPRPAPVAPPAPLAMVRPFPRAASRTCCWPIGEPGTSGFRFCSGDATPGKPYCAEHAALAYVKVRDRREDAA